MFLMLEWHVDLKSYLVHLIVKYYTLPKITDKVGDEWLLHHLVISHFFECLYRQTAWHVKRFLKNLHHIAISFSQIPKLFHHLEIDSSFDRRYPFLLLVKWLNLSHDLQHDEARCFFHFHYDL